MSEFGDSEPEDAWSPEDSVGDMIHNLIIRCSMLDHGPRRLNGSVPEIVAELKERVLVKLKQRDLDHFDRNRGEMILEDADLVLDRFLTI